jgi:PAS domain-containing protein
MAKTAIGMEIAPVRGGTDVPIKPSMIARIVAAGRYVATGNGQWFGPGEPLAPVAPESTAGRQFNYPVAVNINTTTKSDGLTFDQLRQVADACDVIRTLIETRKDQMCGMSWVIQPVEDAPPLALGAKPPVDPRIVALTAFFKSPDKQHTWAEWLRMLLEDMFVIDAPTLYLQQNFGGELYALRPIDGSTIKRLIDPRGWTPMSPDPAYQQVLRGMPAIDYTVDELIYKPRNPRTHRIYGYSPVEQVIVTAQLLLSRQASNLEFYQSGNLPEGFLQGGVDWTPEQIGQFQEHLDTLLSGNHAERRKVRVVPATSSGNPYQAVKEPALKSEFDEWLTRIACFAFNYPPSAFIKDMNRATSESAKQAADEEGVNPLRHWVKELIDGVIHARFGFDDLEFAFEDREAQDPLERAQIDQIYLQTMVLHPDEVRADLGKPPLTPEQQDDMKPPPPVVVAPGDPNAPPAKGDEKKKSVIKRAPRQLKPIDRKTAAITKATTRLTGTLTAALSLAAEEAAKQLAPALGKAAPPSDDRTHSLIDDMSLPALYEASDDLYSTLTSMAADGADKALTQLNIGGDTESMFTLANKRAIAFANKRAAELIKSDAGGGELLDGTRALIRGTVEDAVADGWSPQKLLAQLRDSYAFSPERAETIARTEVAIAHVAGSMEGYRASGVVEKKVWLLAEDPCEICQGNADEGAIDLDDDFSSGDDAAPAHPRCLVGETHVAAAGVRKTFKRRFHGEVVRIRVGSEHLTATPNHPVLTARGWVAIGELQVGDYVAQAVDGKALIDALGNPDDHNMESRIEEMAGSLLKAGGVSAMPVPLATEDFHGDGLADTEVDVVATTGALSHDGVISAEHLKDYVLGIAHVAGVGLPAGGADGVLSGGNGSTADGSVGSGSTAFADAGRDGSGFERAGFTVRPQGQTATLESVSKGAAVTTELASEVASRLTGHVRLVQVEDCIRIKDFDGHVFNLETVGNWYVAASILTHNCECDTAPIVFDDTDTETDPEE